MKKRLLSIFVCFMLIISMAACGGAKTGGDTASSGSTSAATDNAGAAAGSASETASTAPKASNEPPFNITMMYIVGNAGDDFPKVEAAISDLAKKDINMTVDLVTVTFGNFMQQQQLMLSSGEPLDTFTMFGGNAATYISNGYLVDIAPLIDKYGQGIIAQFGEEIAKAPRMNGFQYLLPEYKEYTYPGGVNMRTDILKTCGIDPGTIKSFQDLAGVFKTVKEKNPNMDIVAGDFVNNVCLNYYDGLGDNYGALMNEEGSSKIQNWFESAKYMELANLVRDWYKAGYVKKDLATSTETSESFIKAGNAFSYFCPQKPNTAQEKASQTGYEMTCIPLVPLYTSSANIAGIGYAIAANTKDPVKAMQFLNWAYTTPGFMNLIDWGIEGEHYVVIDKENGIIDFPAGQNVQTCKYHQDLGWALPNQGIAYMWKGNQPGLWDKYKAFNDSAKKSIALGFLYDPSKVVNEIAACTAVYQKYYKAIGCGSVDPNEYITKFNKELYAAGLQKIMDEKQTQLDAWLKNK